MYRPLMILIREGQQIGEWTKALRKVVPLSMSRRFSFGIWSRPPSKTSWSSVSRSITLGLGVEAAEPPATDSGSFPTVTE